MNLEKIVRTAGVRGSPRVELVRNKRRFILGYKPCSRYENESFGIDTAHIEEVSILGGRGAVLATVDVGQTTSYSDGSCGGRAGESVGDAFGRLGSRSSRARYVLRVEKYTTTDNVAVVSESPDHQIRGEVTRAEKRVRLYVL